MNIVAHVNISRFMNNRYVSIELQNRPTLHVVRDIAFKSESTIVHDTMSVGKVVVDWFICD